MTNLLTLISKSLAAKLIIALVSLIIIGVGISWYTLIHTGRKNLVQEAVKNATSYSDLIKKSIRYDMLTFDRAAVQRTIDDLKSAKDIKGIKLFDSMGEDFLLFNAGGNRATGRHDFPRLQGLSCRLQ